MLPIRIVHLLNDFINVADNSLESKAPEAVSGAQFCPGGGFNLARSSHLGETVNTSAAGGQPVNCARGFLAVHSATLTEIAVKRLRGYRTAPVPAIQNKEL